MGKALIMTVVCLLALTGCSQGQAEDETAAESSPSGPVGPRLTLPPAPTAATSTAGQASTAASPETASEVTSERGHIVASTGQQVGVANADGSQAVIFSIDEIVVDPPCTGGGQPATDHHLGIRVRVTTGDLASIGGTWSLSAIDFAVVRPDGTTEFAEPDEGALTCLPAGDRLTTEPMTAGMEHTGTVVVGSPTPTGTLVLSTPALQGNGWEWPF